MEKAIKYIIIGCVTLIFGCAKKNVTTTSRTNVKHSKKVSENTNSSTSNNTLQTGSYKATQTKIEEDTNIYIDPFEEAFLELKAMLDGKDTINFKRAVFITENAYYGKMMDYNKFCAAIDKQIGICRRIMYANNNKLIYHLDDRESVLKNMGIFQLMVDTTTIRMSEEGEIQVLRYPYIYDFEDVFGEKDWSNSFVIKLLNYGSGNCHSLPFLYKIFADELGTDAHLALAPNHIYVKHKNKKDGWYNTELTSGAFPRDDWVNGIRIYYS